MKCRTINMRSLRLLLIPAFATALIACGGGSGGTDDVLASDPNGDIDGDGILNFEDVDLTFGPDEFGPDGFPDGVDDNFQGDLITDITPDPNPVTADAECAGPANTSFDTNSSTGDWADNCQLEIDGIHATSSYSEGVQQILDCIGIPVGDVDGIFGPNTESGVQAFQDSNGLLDDGIVGPQTWGALQDTLVIVPSPSFDDSFTAFGVGPFDADPTDGLIADDRLPECVDQALFYQDSFDNSWRRALTPGSADMGPFSI